MEAKDEVHFLKLTRLLGTSLEVIISGKRALITFVRYDHQGVLLHILAPLDFEFIRDNAKVREKA